MSTVLGHRGASAQHQENTLEAFRVAFEQGAAGVEFDVRRCRDGAVVVHHDPVLADGRAIVELGRSELPDYVPGLDEVIALCCEQRRDAILNIEIKSGREEPDFDERYPVVVSVLDVVASARLDGAQEAQVWVTSFDPGAIAAARRLDPAMATGPITESLLDVATVAAEGHGAVMAWYRILTADYVASAHELGLRIGAWTVNQPADLENMVALGVDYVMTDYPARGVEIVGTTG